MENFLAVWLIPIIAVVWLSFLAAAWRAVTLEARDRGAMYSRNCEARIDARRDTLRAWRWNNSPIDIRD